MKIRFVALAVATMFATAEHSLAMQPPDQPRRGSFAQGRPARGPELPQVPGNAGGRRPGNPLVLALDTDGDGVLSAAEIAAAAAALKTLDRNGDGKLSRDELRPIDLTEQRFGGGLEDRRGQSPRGPGGPGPRDRGQRQGPDRTSANARPANPAPPGTSAPAVRNIVPGPLPGFVAIPGGEFDMGDHHDLGGQEHSSDEVPIHRVRVDSFSIAITETTNRQYCDYLDAAQRRGLIDLRDGLVYSRGGKFLFCDTHLSDPASSIQAEDGKFFVIEGRADHPVVCIRWHGAAAYCNWRSQQEGYETCYDAATWQCDFTNSGFRLPTEAEWEYAGRGGLRGPYYIFPWGDEPDFSRANWPNSGDPFEAGSLAWTTPVGFYNGKLHRKADFAWPGNQETYRTSDGSNGYGLYGMAGNVWEWVGDWYDHNYYSISPLENPHGPDEGQPMRDGKPYRVLRSGSWYNGQWGHSRVSNRNPSYYRGPDDPNHRWYHVGFRVVLKTANTN